MKLLGGLIEIATISETAYPGDTAGDSMVATLSGSADKSETAQIYSQPGFIGKPFKGNKGLRFRIGSVDIVIATINYSVSIPTNYGETKLYSTDEDGEQQASLYLDNEGNLTVNDGEDYAVRYSALETAFNQLKDDFDSLVSLYNAHIHITTATVGSTAVVGTLSATTSQGSSSTADISDAKIEEILVP